jgi:hypothetical protein
VNRVHVVGPFVEPFNARGNVAGFVPGDGCHTIGGDDASDRNERQHTDNDYGEGIAPQVLVTLHARQYRGMVSGLNSEVRPVRCRIAL